jgi:hypothetical protein
VLSLREECQLAIIVALDGGLSWLQLSRGTKGLGFAESFFVVSINIFLHATSTRQALRFSRG